MHTGRPWVHTGRPWVHTGQLGAHRAAVGAHRAAVGAHVAHGYICQLVVVQVSVLALNAVTTEIPRRTVDRKHL